MSPLLKGIAIGFSIAAPVGSIGVLCIRRSLAEGSLMGLFTGLGAATADAANPDDSSPLNRVAQHNLCVVMPGGHFLTADHGDYSIAH